jgi:hypothetical protein
MRQRDAGEVLALQLVADGACRVEYLDFISALPSASESKGFTTCQGTYVKGEHSVNVHPCRDSGDVLATFTRWGSTMYYRGDGWSVCACLIESGYVLLETALLERAAAVARDTAAPPVQLTRHDVLRIAQGMIKS